MTFAQKLEDLLNKSGMNQSQLAARMWGEKKDGRGYIVARNRDSIGHYLSGRIPKPETMKKMAKALSVPVAELEAFRPPPQLRRGQSSGNDDVRITTYASGPRKGVASLRVNVQVSPEIAEQIRDLIRDDATYALSPW